MGNKDVTNSLRYDDGPAAASPRSSQRREIWLGAVLVVLTFWLLTEVRLWKPGARFTIQENVQIGEAEAWWNGRFDLPERKWDTALKDGRVYSYFPPMFTILAAGWVPFTDGVPHGFMTLLATAVPVCAYLLLYRVTRSPLWGAVLAIGYVCGTSVWPILDRTMRSGMPYHVNHTLATIGVLLLLGEYFGRRRVWLAGIGLAVAAWSRQLTVIYLVPMTYMACCGYGGRVRAQRVAGVAATGLVVAAVFCGLNALKFGDPLTSGYQLNHEGRDDVFAREAREHGLLSTHWVKRNLYYANLGLPNVYRVASDGRDRILLKPNNMGTGIWWTSPLLLWLFADAPRLWRRRSTVILFAAVLAVYGALTFWHATGAHQRGYNRYSLDYLPGMFALLAPYCVVGWRRWVTLGMIAWSVLYFRVLMWMPYVQVWSTPQT